MALRTFLHASFIGGGEGGNTSGLIYCLISSSFRPIIDDGAEGEGRSEAARRRGGEEGKGASTNPGLGNSAHKEICRSKKAHVTVHHFVRAARGVPPSWGSWAYGPAHAINLRTFALRWRPRVGEEKNRLQRRVRDVTQSSFRFHKLLSRLLERLSRELCAH